MTPNENFNMIIKKFILNEFLLMFTIVSYIGGFFTAIFGLVAFAAKDVTSLQICYIGIFFLFLAIICNCLWYCLREYDRKYGLFKGWEDGCDVCKQLVAAKSYDSGKKYNIIITTHFDQKHHILAKGYPLYCSNCGRKLSSFNTPRYW